MGVRRYLLALAAASAASAAPAPAVISESVAPPAPYDQPPPQAPTQQPREPTSAADVAGAPIPGDESGRVDSGDRGDSTLRLTGRYALFAPKLVLDLALFPIRTGVWAYDRYQLDDLYYRVFFNEARTIGLYPTFGYDTGYGANGLMGGARFVARDLFGQREHVALVAGTGMMYRQIYSAELRSGDRLGPRVELELDAGLEQRPRDAFYGIGNRDLASAVAAPIDPQVDQTAVAVHYRQQRERIALRVDVNAWSSLHVRAAAAVS
jgi:hypothetical protein